jgi:hypothetical protein
MATDKYDLHTIDYSVQGWDSILTTDMEKLDDVIQTRLLATLGETVAAGKAVCIHPDGKYYKVKADYQKQLFRGVTLEAGVLNDEVRVQRVGSRTDAGWAWSAIGELVYLSPDATQKQKVGIAVAATKIILFSGVHIETEIVCVDNEVVCINNNVITI